MSQLLMELMARAKTFTNACWHYQDPQYYSPYGLASIGYTIVSLNTLQCVICHHNVHFSQDMSQQLEYTLTNLMAHKQSCPYRNDKMTIISRQQLYLRMDDVMDQMQTLNDKSRIDEYPMLDSQAIEREVAQDAFTYNKVLPLYGIDPKEYNISFVYNFFGWFLNKNVQQQPCAQCFFCGRSVVLSNYALQKSIIQSRKKQQQSESGKLFDVVNQHRYFCLWVGKTKGWLVYLQHLYDKISEYTGYKLKGVPIESKKMRVQIDKFIDSWRQKMQASFQTCIKSIKICEQITQQLMQEKNISLDSINLAEDMKRLRDYDNQVQLLIQQIHNGFSNPFKKIKLN